MLLSVWIQNFFYLLDQKGPIFYHYYCGNRFDSLFVWIDFESTSPIYNNNLIARYNGQSAFSTPIITSTPWRGWRLFQYYLTFKFRTKIFIANEITAKNIERANMEIIRIRQITDFLIHRFRNLLLIRMHIPVYYISPHQSLSLRLNSQTLALFEKFHLCYFKLTEPLDLTCSDFVHGRQGRRDSYFVERVSVKIKSYILLFWNFWKTKKPWELPLYIF